MPVAKTTKPPKSVDAADAFTAQLHGSRLTLSFPAAQGSALWQMDLGVFSLIGFSLVAGGKGTQLVFTGDDLPPQSLANFTTPAKAEAALAELNALLAEYEPLVAADATVVVKKRNGGGFGGAMRTLGKWVLRLAGLALVLFVIYVLAQAVIQPDQLVMPADDTAAAPVASQQQPVPVAPAPQPAPAALPQGVPLSADDLLAE